jgi:hypothetical protein
MWKLVWLKVTAVLWQLMEAVLLALRPVGRFLLRRPHLEKTVDRLVSPPEELLKKVTFNCQMCGQCILHSTGLTCPMNCPKNLRNGPCGGVRPNGYCEVKPEMRCVWVLAYERSLHLPWAEHMHYLNPPVDRRLQGTSSWLNFMTRRDQMTPAGWKVRRLHEPATD